MFRNPKEIAFFCITFFLSLVVCIVFGEVLLRATGTYETWAERNGRKYASPYRSRDSWYHTLRPNSNSTYWQIEFDFPRHTNSLGFRGREWAEIKPKGVTRILALGDSFTEGQGAELKNSYPKILERKLKEKGHDVEVMNAGVAGSDPFFQHVLLRDKLVRFSPDFVLVMINTTDIKDIVIRGGFERFQEDGTVAPPRQPRVEIIYKYSFLFRFFYRKILGRNSLFLSKEEMILLQESAISELVDAIKSVQNLGKEESFDLLVIIQPLRSDLEKGRDPMPAVARSLNQHDIPFFDVTASMSGKIGSAQSVGDFFWEMDQHFNAAGYAILAESILAHLLENEKL